MCIKRENTTYNIQSCQYVNTAKYLGTINNQIPKSGPGRQKFSDDHPHQAKADVYFHIADNKRHRARQQHLKQNITFSSAQRID